MNRCIFCQIRDKKVPVRLLYEDDEVMVFPDRQPVRPVHLLIVPKKHLPDFLAIDKPELFEKLLRVVQQMIQQEGLQDQGYRVVINGGGAQIVPHLHLHLMGPMSETAAIG